MGVEENKATQSPCYKSPLPLTECLQSCRYAGTKLHLPQTQRFWNEICGLQTIPSNSSTSHSPWSALHDQPDQHNSHLPGPTAPAVFPHSLFFPKQPEGACEHLGQVPLLCPLKAPGLPPSLGKSLSPLVALKALYNLPLLLPLARLTSRLSLFTIPPICHTHGCCPRTFALAIPSARNAIPPSFFLFFLPFFFFFCCIVWLTGLVALTRIEPRPQQ